MPTINDHLTARTRRILALALQEALRRGDHEVATHHLFIGLIEEATETMIARRSKTKTNDEFLKLIAR